MSLSILLQKETIKGEIFHILGFEAKEGVLKPKIISNENESLNVCHYVRQYMARTLPLREEAVSSGFEKPTQLFLSWIIENFEIDNVSEG